MFSEESSEAGKNRVKQDSEVTRDRGDRGGRG